MFRFSIRDLLLVTMVAATGTAWLVEHWRLQAAMSDVIECTKSAEYWEKKHKQFLQKIEEELESHDLDIGWQAHNDGSPPSPIIFGWQRHSHLSP